MIRKKKKRNEYFGKNVEDAIIQYNTSHDPKEKNKIFNTLIYPAFDELVQNILYNAIKKGNPYRSDVSYEDLKHETVVFLFEKIGFFEPGRGSLAFSFFNRVAMNYLLAKSQKVYNNMKNYVDMEIIDTQRDLDQEINIDLQRRELRDFIKVWSKNCNARLEILFEKQAEQKVANAIFNLFENLELIDIYDKKALYILIREQVDVKTHHITSVMAEVKKLFENNYKYHLSQREKEDGLQDEVI